MKFHKLLLFLTILGTIVSCGKTTDTDNAQATPDTIEVLTSQAVPDFYSFFAELQAVLKANKGAGLEKFFDDSYRKTISDEWLAEIHPDLEQEFYNHVKKHYLSICELTKDNNYTFITGDDINKTTRGASCK